MLHHEKPLPANRLALAGFAVAAGAFVLAVYGSFFAPGHLRDDEPPLPALVVRVTGYYAPLGLGLVGLVLGAVGLRRIESASGRLGGDMQGVFAVMLGGLAAVVGGVQVFAAHVWPALRGSLLS